VLLDQLAHKVFKAHKAMSDLQAHKATKAYKAYQGQLALRVAKAIALLAQQVQLALKGRLALAAWLLIGAGSMTPLTKQLQAQQRLTLLTCQTQTLTVMA
jgi:hypothetical protein